MTALGAGVDLRLRAVGDLQERFLVPRYQRGYRWGVEEVLALVKDLHAIRDHDYCLQPIVVRRRDDGTMEVVDGQQRLTTLFLIFRYMQVAGYKKGGAPFSIEYETRPRSGEYLVDLDASRSRENVDFFHLHQAATAIGDWFESHGHRAELVATTLYQHLFERVKVIWYEVAESVDGPALFTRLNVGRIPLTNAELVKALLLGHADERLQMEIATRWDLIERELNEPAFWAFLTNAPGSKYPTRIQIIFELIAGAPGARDPFHAFFDFKKRLDGGQGPESAWRAVLDCHETLREWYDDRDLYHHIGYIVSAGGAGDLRELLVRSREHTKSQFASYLIERIRKRLHLDAEDLQTLDYEHHEESCRRALLLFNVETTRRLSLDRFPFDAHKSNAWSLEHVHAQSAEALRTTEQWQQWLTEHTRALRDLPISTEETPLRDGLVREMQEVHGVVTADSFARISSRVAEMFSRADETDEVHGIANLTLLSLAGNSALGNAVFEVKRRRVLEMDRRGEYIPICTRRVFLKYYTPAADQHLHFWSGADREAYLDALKEALGPYLAEPSVNIASTS